MARTLRTIASDGQDCCGDVGIDVTDDGGCCNGNADATGSERLGYDTDDIASVADGADPGLGCGNPKAFAEMAPGETVLDLLQVRAFDRFPPHRRSGWGRHRCPT